MIFRTGQRACFRRILRGLNTSAAVSPDGTKVAMILSRSGNPNVWVCNADGTGLKQLTHTSADDSCPCWSPDGQWICYATKIKSRRVLAKVSAEGGEPEVVHTSGAPNPTEPDWSPDGKWIAFCSQAGEFDICVVPADGSGSTHHARSRAASVLGAQFAHARLQPGHQLPAGIVRA